MPKHSIFDLSDETLKIDGYNMFHSGLQIRGVCIYTANHLIANQFEPSSNFDESVWCEIMNDKEKLIIGCIYRSPSSTDSNCVNLLSLLEEVTSMKYDQLVIVGDFNYKEVDWPEKYVHAREDHMAYKTYDKINDLFLTQYVNEPTRYREGEKPSLLDWVLSDNENTMKISQSTIP